MEEAPSEKLKLLAAAFHDAIDRMDRRDCGSNLKNFPIECCHHACNFLGIFLWESGFTNIQKISGFLPNDSKGKHRWLLVDGNVVDITAWQFDGFVRGEIVVARNSAFHETLHGNPVLFGLEDEELGTSCVRIKDGLNRQLNGLYDKLAAVAVELFSQRSRHLE